MKEGIRQGMYATGGRGWCCWWVGLSVEESRRVAGTEGACAVSSHVRIDRTWDRGVDCVLTFSAESW